jgi:hypothetical protein
LIPSRDGHGLATLAFQVNPSIQPKEIIQLLIETVVKTDAGPIVNPGDFIEKVRARIKKGTGDLK